MVRPLRHEIERYGEYSKAGESVYDHPHLWGSKRTGPDLARVGGKYPNLWHVRHLEDPQSTSKNSVMPAYAFLLENELDLSKTAAKIDTMIMLGVPYRPKQADTAVADARVQAEGIAKKIVAEGGRDGLANKEVVALVAYLQRLGMDLKRVRAQEQAGGTDK